MNHSMRAIISNRRDHIDIINEYPELHIKILANGYFAIPFNDDLSDELDIEPNEKFDCNKTLFLSPQIFALLHDLSDQGIVAYIETDYFGRIGMESALVMLDGEFLFGPKLSTEETGEGSPIQIALEKIGVMKQDDLDVFQTLNLHHYRDFEDFFKE